MPVQLSEYINQIAACNVTPTLAKTIAAHFQIDVVILVSSTVDKFGANLGDILIPGNLVNDATFNQRFNDFWAGWCAGLRNCGK